MTLIRNGKVPPSPLAGNQIGIHGPKFAYLESHFHLIAVQRF